VSFTRFANVLQTNVEIQAFKYVQEIAEAMTNEAKEILETQRYSWQPLSQGYWEWKDRNNLDTRILIATGFYQEHISGGVEGGKVWWGVEDIVHEPSGLDLKFLARIHEFGYGHVPARPLWRPLLSKYIRLSPQFAKRYRREVERAARKAKALHLGSAKKVKVRL